MSNNSTGGLPLAAPTPLRAARTTPAESFLPTSDYTLLPFRFHPLGEDREVLVSEVGDFLMVDRGTADRLVARAIPADDPIMSDLVGTGIVARTVTPSLLDRLAARYRTRLAFLDSFTALHIMVMSLRCNYSCHYCQVSRKTADRSRYDMSREAIDATLDLIFRSPSPDLTIEFQGGEPLLVFDEIEYTVLEALRRNVEAGRALRFVICSNLSLLTPEMLEFCRRYDVLLSTSPDGPPSLHQANRPGGGPSAFEEFAGNVRLAREVLGADRVAALMTTSHAALSQPEAIVDAYLELGFRRIFLRPIQPYGFASRLSPRLRYGPEAFVDFYTRALTYIIALNTRGVDVTEEYAGIILRKMFSPYPTGFVDLQSPTGLITGVAVYNYDGSVYPSDEARMLAETGDQRFRLGSVHDGYAALFQGPPARELVADGVIESIPGCSDCGLQAYCGADPVRNWAQEGDLVGFRPTSSFCHINMSVISLLLTLLDTDTQAASILRRWAA